MIGWVVTEAQAALIEEQVRAAYIARRGPGAAIYWLPGAIPIATGPHASLVPGVTNVLIPMSDDDKIQRMTNGTRTMDFPEYPLLAAQLGGEGARVDVDVADFWTPDL